MNINKYEFVLEIKKIRGRDEIFDDLEFITKAISADKWRLFLTGFVVEKNKKN